MVWRTRTHLDQLGCRLDDARALGIFADKGPRIQQWLVVHQVWGNLRRASKGHVAVEGGQQG